MAFTNDPAYEDDFRKVGPDATAGFAPTGTPSDPTAHAGSENLSAAATDEDEELEDDEDLDDEDEDDDDLEDDDLDDDDEDVAAEDEDDLDEEEDDDDEDDHDDDELEDDDASVQARLAAAEKRARAA